MCNKKSPSFRAENQLVAHIIRGTFFTLNEWVRTWCVILTTDMHNVVGWLASALATPLAFVTPSDRDGSLFTPYYLRRKPGRTKKIAFHGTGNHGKQPMRVGSGGAVT